MDRRTIWPDRAVSGGQPQAGARRRSALASGAILFTDPGLIGDRDHQAPCGTGPSSGAGPPALGSASGAGDDGMGPVTRSQLQGGDEPGPGVPRASSRRRGPAGACVHRSTRAGHRHTTELRVMVETFADELARRPIARTTLTAMEEEHIKGARHRNLEPDADRGLDPLLSSHDLSLRRAGNRNSIPKSLRSVNSAPRASAADFFAFAKLGAADRASERARQDPRRLSAADVAAVERLLTLHLQRSRRGRGPPGRLAPGPDLDRSTSEGRGCR